ncbi:unnamed protein product [Rodentolepis nana]|uniref:DHC_N1 domain-containing protein n=1 Tax=Rodentolepis nana TaxID=102285 RepID=A0A158QHK3_RODNA|nr:unnamed protein product [Rodentolepis nana]
MDDNRVLWIKHIVYIYFNLKSDEIFADFLKRDEKINYVQLQRFLDGALEPPELSVLFTIKKVKETIFEEVKVPIDPHSNYHYIGTPITSSTLLEYVDENKSTKVSERNTNKDELDLQSVGSEDDVIRFRKYGSCCFMESDVQYLCLLRVQNGSIYIPNSLEQAIATMPTNFEIMFATGKWLYQLQSILSKVYLSQLSTIVSKPTVHKLKLSDAYRTDELTLKYHKFLQVVSETSDLLHSGNEFEIPSIDIEGDTQIILQNEKITNIIETTVIQWGFKLREIIDELKTRSTRDEGPLAEIEYWRDRATSLGRLVDEVSRTQIQRILELYSLKERISPQSVFEVLHRCYIEATDNVKFLELVKRYFKIMTYHTDINDIIESLNPLMQALQMIWIISPYYSKDDRMCVIFERIAWCLCDRVSRMLSPTNLFKIPFDDMLTQINNGKKLLESWKSTYMTRRADIEASGREYRWEFDKNRLFGKSDYMITVCNDMKEVVHIIKEYKTMFGPEIKSMVSDQKHFDLLTTNISKLPENFKFLSFDPFVLENKYKWESQMQQFHLEVNALDFDAKGCLEDSFQTLHSSDNAFKVLQRLLESHPRKYIAKLFEERYSDILERYGKELRLIETTFTEGSADAGRFAALLGPRYFPPISSSIYWVRHLQARITAPMLKMHRIELLMDSDRGKEVHDQYLCLIKRMIQFENDLYSRWCQHVRENLGGLMERKLWKSVAISKPNSSMKSSQRTSLATTLMKRHSVFGREVSRQAKAAFKFYFEVDFGEELIQIIAETKFLQTLGLGVPDSACCVALKEKVLLRQKRALEELANSVRTRTGALSHVEVITLADHLSQLRAALEPAWEQLNWTSLIIDRFLVKADEAFHKFCKLLKTVAKARAKIELILRQIAKVSLFHWNSDTNESSELRSFKTYLQQMLDARTVDFENLAMKHAEASRILFKLEKDITGKPSTGKNPTMIHYYEFWERQFFDVVHQMVINNLKKFLRFLQHPKISLFAVDLMLAGSDVVSTPQPADFHQLMIQDVRDAIKSTQAFIRWQPRTCLASQGIKVPNQEGLVYFTFYDDIVKSTAVKDVFYLIDLTILQAGEKLKRQQEKYRHYKHLLAPHKKYSVEKWRTSDPTVAQISQRIYDINTALDDLNASIADSQIDFFTLRTKLLIDGLQMHRQKWIYAYGSLFKDRIYLLSRQLKDTIRNFQSQLQIQPTNRNHLQDLLITLRNIKDAGLLNDEQLAGIVECRNRLRQNGLEITPNEEADFKGIQESWENLLKQAREKEDCLSRQRKRFKYATKCEANQFDKIVNKFIQKFETEGPMNVGENLDYGLVLMKECSEEIQGLTTKHQELLVSERLFDLPPSYSKGLIKAKKQMESLQKIYKIYADQKALIEEWSKVPWRDAHFTVLQNEVELLQQMLQKVSKQIPQMEVAKVLEIHLSAFADSVALLSDLKNEALRPRHWTMLIERTKNNFAFNSGEFTLGNIFDMHIDQFKQEVVEVLSVALSEFSVEKELVEVNEKLKNLRFEIQEYAPKGKKQGLIFAGLDEIVQTLDDNSIGLQSMGSSRFAIPFIEKIRQLEKEIAIASEVLDNWIAVQRKWLNLEGIFASGEIHSQMGKEADRFNKLNLVFKKTVEEALKSPSVLTWCLKSGRSSELMSISTGFETCEKSLIVYLKTKRNAFPRFFFIADYELLSILGSSEYERVQEHLIKMFDNIKSLEFAKNEQDIPVAVGMISNEGEKVKFKEVVQCTGGIEDWMAKVEITMRETIRSITKEGIYRYRESMERVDWVMRYQGMVALAASQVWWTWEVEDAFRRITPVSPSLKQDKSAMKKLSMQQLNQLGEIVQRIRGELSTNDRAKLVTLLTIDVHARDVVDGFVRNSVIEANSFEWQSQLRFYWSRSCDHLHLRQCNGSFDYGYEYLGLNSRLVITPLTDRIYLTLTQALSIHLGACAAGPAGTGKTETVKDLAKALATFCLVTNCGGEMDYKSLGRIFSGICQAGAWGCFDEFNRIEISVLSVISTQLRLIHNAHSQSARRFVFEGEEINFNPRVGVFITMNPGYAGRTELPESVKVQFRQVVVAVPDRKLICEVLLFAQGFSKARMLAEKIHTFYYLAERQLSKQHHYDFSMRALKAVLQMAGELRRHQLELDEISMVIRALRDVNLPKLIHEDVRLFLDLISDLFPGLPSLKSESKEFSDAVKDWLSSEKYIVVEKQVEKVLQLNETMLTRHSTMVVGPTCGGKSVVILAYCGAQSKLGTPTNLLTLNPKDRCVTELYGVLDPNTRNWTDGLLTRLFRDSNKTSGKKENTIILFDGDVDSLWVENMNSVMDDNRLLTLPNGERIRLQPYCHLIFEVGDLEYASPATVSRCGMVYINSQDLEYSVIWQMWKLNNKDLDDYYLQILDNLFEKYLPRLMALNLNFVLPLTPVGLINQLCCLLRSLLLGVKEASVDCLEAILLQALTFSIGSCLLNDSDRMAFDDKVKELSALPTIVEEGEEGIKEGFIPNTHPRLEDFYFDLEKRVWLPWSRIVPSYQHKPEIGFSEIFVPTRETIIMKWVLEKNVQVDRPVLLVGKTTTAKTTSVNQFLMEQDISTHLIMRVNFSYRTTADDLFNCLDANLEKRNKGLYGPFAEKRLLLFIDDLHMPETDPYGTQQPLALLKLLLTNRGFYDRSNSELKWRRICDTSCIAAMALIKRIDPRLLSKFTVFHATPLSESTLFSISSSILSDHFQTGFQNAIVEAIPSIIQATLSVYWFLLQKLHATPAKFHYTFNFRDLRRVYEGLCRMSPGNFSTLTHVIRLWRHEMLRIFVDRLTTDEDVNLVKSRINSETSNLDPLTKDETLKDPVLFGEYTTELEVGELAHYEDKGDYNAVKNIFNKASRQYLKLSHSAIHKWFIKEQHSEHSKLILFNDGIEHLSRLHRIMSTSGGHGLCVGVSGSGRTVLIKLAALAAGCDVFQITLSRNYTEKEFREEVKNLYLRLVKEDKRIVFLISEDDIIDEAFLEIVNRMLVGTNVSSFFSEEERETIANDLQKDLLKNGLDGTREVIWDNLSRKAAKNLHIIMVMSPESSTLRRRCANFPGLLTNTTMDWYFAWPEEALQVAASATLSPENPLIPSQHYDALIDHIVHVHRSVDKYTREFMEKWKRTNFVTPRHFLDYIDNYMR